MTEAEWLTCAESLPMLEFLRLVETGRRKTSLRQLYLFACACCRDNWDLPTDGRSRLAIEVTERFADGDATEDELDAAHEGAGVVSGRPEALAAAWVSHREKRRRGRGVIRGVAWVASLAVEGEKAAADSRQAGMLREIHGNPFRPVIVEADWRTPTVVSLAGGIYDDRAFDRLPILADALLDAGCGDEAILGHCRSEGPHVKGCWVVDRILEKA